MHTVDRNSYYYGSLLLLFFFIISFSCNSDDGTDQQPEPTKEELIVRDRNISLITYNGQPMTSDTFSFRFQADGRFTFNTPGIPSLPQSGSWELAPDKQHVILNENTELKIVTLTTSRFIFDYVYTNHKMGKVTVRCELE